ncbi:MAG TPA: 2,3-bisphosphoglycerate-independent phosphoglycerate mutase [Candidatus Cybelea sp.]|nr:2,3-bisphosphoglycerate-independent phosphoglycerate mutase [Candidatus Cybelea sp.]
MTERPANLRQRPVVLCVLDGWGYRPEASNDNAIRLARTPNLDRLTRQWPVAHLQASEHFVGLPDGQMGNSEVGHMNLGAGRIVIQDLQRIDAAVADRSIAANGALRQFIAKMKASGGAVHLLGLMSPGGVHSHQDHMAALAEALDSAGLNVWVHAFLDGRDTPPKSAEEYLRRFKDAFVAGSRVRFATVQGRYYAMDRDKRWERVEKAWAATVEARGEHAQNAVAAVAQSYARNVTDEFVLPTVIGGYPGVKDGDGVVMANFRADRAREILRALLDPSFDGFARPHMPRIAAALGLSEYSEDLNRFMATMFPSAPLTKMLGDIVSRAGLKQLRIAETEKYAHVTFFFNGGVEEEYPGETRILVPSPKVATYDEKPEMSAFAVTDRLVAEIESGRQDFIVVNYANTDMVGHTGDLKAAIRAVEAVDTCLGRLSDAVVKAGGALLITADHGNAEMMRDPKTGQPHTAHTTNPVPAILINAGGERRNHPVTLHDGRLADVAPTLLQVLGLPQPHEMTGRSLIDEPGGSLAPS